MYKNKINVTNKTNSSELVSPYIGFLSIFCTELSAPIGRDALCPPAELRSANGRQPLD